MTAQEIEIAQRFAIPCSFTYRSLSGNLFFKNAKIKAVHRYYNEEMKQFFYSATMVPNNERGSYHAEIADITPLSGWDLFIRNKLQEKKDKQLLELSKELLAEKKG